MTQERKLTGRHVLFIFLAFFITVTGVNALMVTFAVRSFSAAVRAGGMASHKIP